MFAKKIKTALSRQEYVLFVSVSREMKHKRLPLTNLTHTFAKET